ncbi:DUF6397 family protein [Streptomyces sp. URMC 126]|uniref:DUF6397 family protein n=1 Tax=Streptomyces sp. URMC 126 TaxID=3423401 RepID=UPI003F1C6BE8
MTGRCVSGGVAESGVPFGRAARELGLKAGELELAVQLAEVRTTAGWGPGSPRRIRREDIERHRSADGFPDALKGRLRTVGTKEGAELAGIAPARFTRLARSGLLVPVRFWINRYGAVVWQYLASDVTDFVTRRSALLTGRLPAELRTPTGGGGDRRGERWRGLRVEQLEAQAEDPWQRVAAVAAVLPPDRLVRAVPDPADRAWVSALRPALTTVRPEAPAGRAAVEGLLFADGPEEIARYQARVASAVAEARACGSPPGRERAEGGAVLGAGAGAGVRGAAMRQPALPVSGFARLERTDPTTADTAPGARDEPPVPASADGPDAVGRERAAASPAAGGAASIPRSPSGTPVARVGRSAPAVNIPLPSPGGRGMRSVRRTLERFLGRAERPRAAARRERPAGRTRPEGRRRTVPGRPRRHDVGRPMVPHPVAAYGRVKGGAPEREG